MNEHTFLLPGKPCLLSGSPGHHLLLLQHRTPILGTCSKTNTTLNASQLHISSQAIDTLQEEEEEGEGEEEEELHLLQPAKSDRMCLPVAMTMRHQQSMTTIVA